MNEELGVAIDAAKRAGAILLRHARHPAAVAWKAPGSPVTAADREASAFLTAAITGRFPQDAVISEEAASLAPPPRGRAWLIDPMDGTSEFIEGRDEFSVMIGLLEDRRPVLGVVYQPVAGKLYHAVRGAGAFLEQAGGTARLNVSPETEPARMTVARSRSHPSAAADAICERVGIRQHVDAGSIGLKIGLICEGRAHLYLHVERGLWQWDTCAPEVLLTEAGGTMTDLSGAPLRYGELLRHLYGVIASSGVIHRRIVEAWADVHGAPGG
jgi:3'(2'), 5'-bisphosphate nucleotidase